MPLVMALVAASCSSGTSPSSPATAPTSSLSDEDAVFEAVLLHDLATTTVGSGEAVCLAIRGAKTDGRALLAAIKARYPTAVPDTECAGGGFASPVTLRATGGRAVRLDIGPIEWGPDGAAKIASGGAYRGGGVREVDYRVENHGGSWQVTSEKLRVQT